MRISQRRLSQRLTFRFIAPSPHHHPPHIALQRLPVRAQPAEHFVGGLVVERLESIDDAAELRDGGGGGLGMGGGGLGICHGGGGSGCCLGFMPRPIS